MKKQLLALTLSILLSIWIVPFSAFAQVSTDSPATNQPTSLLPEESSTGIPNGIQIDCLRFMKRPTLKKEVADNKPQEIKGIFLDSKGLKEGGKDGNGGAHTINIRQTALSCGIKTGRIDLWLVPYYLVSVIDFALLLSGLASVLFIIIGGYHMIIGGYTDEKEKGKKTITYALLGLVISLVAYTIVNLLLLFLTS